MYCVSFFDAPAFLAKKNAAGSEGGGGGWRKIGKIINCQRLNSAISSKVQQRCFIRYIPERYVTYVLVQFLPKFALVLDVLDVLDIMYLPLPTLLFCNFNERAAKVFFRSIPYVTSSYICPIPSDNYLVTVKPYEEI
jgi:hypothetical protein